MLSKTMALFFFILLYISSQLKRSDVVGENVHYDMLFRPDIYSLG